MSAGYNPYGNPYGYNPYNAPYGYAGYSSYGSPGYNSYSNPGYISYGYPSYNSYASFRPYTPEGNPLPLQYPPYPPGLHSAGSQSMRARLDREVPKPAPGNQIGGRNEASSQGSLYHSLWTAANLRSACVMGGMDVPFPPNTRASSYQLPAHLQDSNNAQPQQPQQHQQNPDPAMVDDLTKLLIQQATLEIMEKFRQEASSFPAEQRNRLRAQNIDPLAFRFRQQAIELIRSDDGENVYKTLPDPAINNINATSIRQEPAHNNLLKATNTSDSSGVPKKGGGRILTKGSDGKVFELPVGKKSAAPVPAQATAPMSQAIADQSFGGIFDHYVKYFQSQLLPDEVLALSKELSGSVSRPPIENRPISPPIANKNRFEDSGDPWMSSSGHPGSRRKPDWVERYRNGLPMIDDDDDEQALRPVPQSAQHSSVQDQSSQVGEEVRLSDAADRVHDDYPRYESLGNRTLEAVKKLVDLEFSTPDRIIQTVLCYEVMYRVTQRVSKGAAIGALMEHDFDLEKAAGALEENGKAFPRPLNPVKAPSKIWKDEKKPVVLGEFKATKWKTVPKKAVKSKDVVVKNHDQTIQDGKSTKIVSFNSHDGDSDKIKPMPAPRKIGGNLKAFPLGDLRLSKIGSSKNPLPNLSFDFKSSTYKNGKSEKRNGATQSFRRPSHLSKNGVDGFQTGATQTLKRSNDLKHDILSADLGSESGSDSSSIPELELESDDEIWDIEKRLTKRQKTTAQESRTSMIDSLKEYQQTFKLGTAGNIRVRPLNPNFSMADKAPITLYEKAPKYKDSDAKSSASEDPNPSDEKPASKDSNIKSRLFRNVKWADDAIIDYSSDEEIAQDGRMLYENALLESVEQSKPQDAKPAAKDLQTDTQQTEVHSNAPDMRTWKDRKGTNTFEAELLYLDEVTHTDAKIYLRKKNADPQDEMWVSWSMMCDEDKEYVERVASVRIGKSDPVEFENDTYQACVSCSRRYLRCDLGPDLVDNPQPPCVRCRRESKDCFFTAARRERKIGGEDTRKVEERAASMNVDSVSIGKSDAVEDKKEETSKAASEEEKKTQVDTTKQAPSTRTGMACIPCRRCQLRKSRECFTSATRRERKTDGEAKPFDGILNKFSTFEMADPLSWMVEPMTMKTDLNETLALGYMDQHKATKSTAEVNNAQTVIEKKEAFIRNEDAREVGDSKAPVSMDISHILEAADAAVRVALDVVEGANSEPVDLSHLLEDVRADVPPSEGSDGSDDFELISERAPSESSAGSDEFELI